ncbi:MAG: hypothetical protein V1793_12380 [Pseudomonadota bacterium]
MTLSGREKLLVSLGLIVVLVFLAVAFIMMPALDRRTSLEKQLASKLGALTQMQSLRTQYQGITRSGQEAGQLIQDRPRNFTLFSFLDTLAEQSGVKDNVAYMKPASTKLEKSSNTLSTVKLKLDNLGYAELVDYISRIETARSGVFIKSISLSRTGKDLKQLEAVIEAQTLVPGDTAS